MSGNPSQIGHLVTGGQLTGTPKAGLFKEMLGKFRGGCKVTRIHLSLGAGAAKTYSISSVRDGQPPKVLFTNGAAPIGDTDVAFLDFEISLGAGEVISIVTTGATNPEATVYFEKP